MKLMVGQLRKILDELPGDADGLPIVVAGGKLKVVDAQVIYQSTFSTMDFCGAQEETPTAVMLKVVGA